MASLNGKSRTKLGKRVETRLFSEREDDTRNRPGPSPGARRRRGRCATRARRAAIPYASFAF